MGRNKNKQTGGSGSGRGGGQADNQQTRQPSRSLVCRKDKDKNRRGQRSHLFQVSGRVSRGAGPLPSANVVEQIPEDGIFRHQEIPRAHADAIMSVVMAADCIYTASRDKLLKRWKVHRDAIGKFQLIAELEVPLGDVCWCLTSAGDWLFCGLGDGSIKGYQKAGQETILKGHSKRVSCLLAHQHVLLSGASDGVIRCWQMDPGSQTFGCTHSIAEGISGAVSAIAVLGERLWVGGSSGIAIIELAILKVSKQVPPKKFVAGLLAFEGHMIVVYADGSVCIFDASGEQKHSQAPLPAGPVLSVAGLESGPRVLCGHAKGQVSSITLPMFHLKKHWQALQRCKVQTLCCAGHDGIFILGAENGTLQLWQRDGSQAQVQFSSYRQ